MNAKPTTRLLAINFGGVGDEVLFLPTLQSIKSEHPDWHVTLLTEPRGRSIKEVTDLIDSNITFDIKKKPLAPSDYFELISLLRNGRYDVVLSSGSSHQVSILLFLSGSKKRIGYYSGALSKLLLTNPVQLNRNQHATYMYHDLVKGLGITRLAQPPTVCVQPEALAAMTDLIRQQEAQQASTISGSISSRRARVLIHPGTSKLALLKGVVKNWHTANWTDLILRLLQRGDVDVILAGGPDDDEPVADIMSRLSAQGSGSAQASLPQNLLVAHGKTRNLAQLCALIHLSDVMVCVDSAPMHLGVGLDKPLVALFGPTDPEKLLIQKPHFVALRDPQYAQSDVDPFTQRRDSVPFLPPPELCVQIPLDTVFRTVEDLLRSVSNQGSSLESGRP